MQLSAGHIIGFLVTMLAMVSIGIYSGKKVKGGTDFSTNSRNAGTFIVVGTIVGTLVGGSSTIGTAQLAFTHGFSAWWFTLGSAAGCLFMGLFYITRVRKSGHDTVQQILTTEYGSAMGLTTSILSTLGMILMIISQILAATALITTIIPVKPFISGLIAVILMICYVMFGGVLGTGILGILKFLLLYVGVIGCIAIIYFANGFTDIYRVLPKEIYFNFVARGVGIDLGNALSMVLGVLCSQTYLQAGISAKSDKVARRGAFISAAIIPPIGLGGLLVGMFMQVKNPTLTSSQVFVTFVLQNMPPLIAGIVLATLLITIIGSGAGVTLGISSIICNNIYKKYIHPKANEKQTLWVLRIIILVVFGIALIFSLGNVGTLILKWGFLSMALRAIVLFVPMSVALFYPGRVNSRVAMMSSIMGTLFVIVGNVLLKLPFDPILGGIIISLLVVCFCSIKCKKPLMQK